MIKNKIFIILNRKDLKVSNNIINKSKPSNNNSNKIWIELIVINQIIIYNLNFKIVLIFI